MNQPHPSSLLQDFPAPAGATPRQRPPAPRRPRRWPWLLAVVPLAAAIYFLWPKRSSSSAGAGTSKPVGASGRGVAPIPVVAARATKGNIGVTLAGLGNVTPIYTVTVRSRVDGQLLRVLYREGDLAHKGDLLVEIDSRPFQVQLAQAEGQLTKDEALLNNARLDLERYQTLLTHNAIPEQQVATQKATVLQYEGAVKSDRSQIESARLNIAYTQITAPITGRVGLRLVDPGNMVHPTDTNGLLVITQIQPISVMFTISEDHLPAVLQKLRAGRRLRVDAYDREMKIRLASGTLTTIDNQIDQTTGTVRIRATFNNQDGALFPNQFVNVRLLVEERQGVTLLPTPTIQRNSQMTYVYVVKPDSTVTLSPVTLGATEDDVTEISSGLAPGEIAVMTGVDRLQEGSTVVVHLNEDAGRRATP